ncbi:hypothetical protein IT414_01220 [bacterium]|nr:hypothetical protein [bacterium]
MKVSVDWRTTGPVVEELDAEDLEVAGKHDGVDSDLYGLPLSERLVMYYLLECLSQEAKAMEHIIAQSTGLSEDQRQAMADAYFSGWYETVRELLPFIPLEVAIRVVAEETLGVPEWAIASINWDEVGQLAGMSELMVRNAANDDARGTATLDQVDAEHQEIRTREEQQALNLEAACKLTALTRQYINMASSHCWDELTDDLQTGLAFATAISVVYAIGLLDPELVKLLDWRD